MIQKMIAKITNGPLVLFFSVVVFFVIFVVVLTVLFMIVSAVAA
jgi:hypothetical protein